jgi:hypothetical protein
MNQKKTTTMNLRVDPAIKEAVREAAEREHRSIANMIEVLIRDHCRAAGISIPEQQTLFDGKDDG